MEIVCLKSKFMFNMFDQNTYVICNDKEAIIIDAGAELEDILGAVKGRKVLAILLTHIHFDHIWNLEKYLEKFDVDVFVIRGQEKKFKDSSLNVSYILNRQLVYDIPKSRIKYFEPKMKFNEFEFDVIKTPGHSKDSICIMVEGNLFSGDTLFDGNIGRTDFIDGSDEEMLSSLKKIKELDFKTVYPGHYNSFNREKADKTISQYLK